MEDRGSWNILGVPLIWKLLVPQEVSVSLFKVIGCHTLQASEFDL